MSPSDSEKQALQEPQLPRKPLRRVIFICLGSYLGYLLLGLWCFLVEQSHESMVSEDPEFQQSVVLELRAATSLMVFAGVRILLLLIFLCERPSNKDIVSIVWLGLSTFLMMAAYFTACLNLDVFFHISIVFVVLFFISIALDFIANIFVIVRHNS